ncbi:MAG: FAD-dependent oxidoreductase, partial [Chloroflexota bacterium]|nr:FAD-dependent oxidoreductase [Chloroflexota bacterium]
MLQLFKKNRMWDKRPLKDRYQVVIIGGGVHGVSTAYYLTKLGIKDIAVLDKGYLGGGASARTTAIIRANYITAEGIPFFSESLKLYEGLATELNFNLLFNQMGRLDLGHTDAAVYGLRMRAGFNRLLGVDSRMVGPKEVKDL